MSDATDDRKDASQERQPEVKPATAGQAGVPRRVALKVLGTVPLAVTVTGLEAATQPAPRKPAAPAAPSAAAPAEVKPKGKFFTDEERKTASMLADMIIPRDEVSGSATEAGVIEFMDEWVDYWGKSTLSQMRGGLAWLDYECTRRFDTRFVDCTDAQRKMVVDLIAFPPKEPVKPAAGEPTTQKAPLEGPVTTAYPQGPPPRKPGTGVPEEEPKEEPASPFSQGIAFFSLFRDLTASGFYTSEMGIKDIGFMGNQPFNWQGCPREVLAKLGLT